MSSPPPARPLSDLSEHEILKIAVNSHRAGKLSEAKDLYRLLLTRNPRNADAIHRLGTIALQVEQYDKAVEFIGKAIDIGPATATMHINRGTALRNLERYTDAINAFDSAIELDPNNSDAYFNKGRTLIADQRYSEAIAANARAIELNPSDAEAWANKGAAEKAKGMRVDSLYSFDKAVSLQPTMTEAYRNIGTVLIEMNLHETGIQYYKKAVSVDPTDITNRYYLTVIQLLTGHIGEAWEDYDVRFDKFETTNSYRRPEPPPYWDGSDPSNKRILLWTEQGIGEQLLAASTFSEFSADTGDCIVECWDRLVPIFQRSFPGIQFVSFEQHTETINDKNKPIDWQMPAFNLIGIYRKSLDKFPVRDAYIKPEPSLRDRLRAKYETMAEGRRIVGLSWTSSAKEFDFIKTTKLEDWNAIIESPDFFVVNLQYGKYEQEVRDYAESFSDKLYDDPEVDPMASLEQAMAQIAAMDLVLSVSNSNVHMAGAMGIPTWLLLPNSTSIFWHWFLGRTDSPWYKSVRIFRQREILDQELDWWIEVLNDISSALLEWKTKPLQPYST